MHTFGIMIMNKNNLPLLFKNWEWHSLKCFFMMYRLIAPLISASQDNYQALIWIVIFEFFITFNPVKQFWTVIIVKQIILNYS